MKEEDTLLKKIGKEHSFKVPDGYFENLTSEVMNKLPEKRESCFQGRACFDMDEIETIILYGGYVCRSCPDYPGSVIRP